MSHLSRDDLVRFAEDTLAPAGRAHLDTCAECRREAEGLAALVADVRHVAVPEPAPAFWDHLSARVRSAIDAEPVPQSAAWWELPQRSRLAWASALVVLAVIVSLSVTMHRTRAPSAEHVAVQPSQAQSPQLAATSEGGGPPAVLAEDEWDVVLAAAGVAEWEPLQAESLMARPGHAELAISELSRDEQDALVRLLNDVLTRAPASRREG